MRRWGGRGSTAFWNLRPRAALVGAAGCRGCRGAVAEGDSREDVLRRLREVLEGVLEFRRDHGLAEPVSVRFTGSAPAGCVIVREAV